jgi:hypothetical protein
MKAVPIITRIGQFIIVAIAFMACVGWNHQAAGLQNNISSITRKRVKDIVKIRYILPHTNLHSVPVLCNNLDDVSNTTSDAISGTNLNNQFIWNSTKKFGKQDIKSCIAVFDQSPLFKQAKTDKMLFPSEKVSLGKAPFSCQSSQSIADALKGQGYFSGFDDPLETGDYADGPVQENVKNISLISMDEYKTPGVPTYVAFSKAANCIVMVCHNKRNNATSAYGNIAWLNMNGSNDGVYPIDDISQSTAGCQFK